MRMLHALTLLAPFLLLFANCSGDVSRRAIGTANENVKVVAGDLKTRPETTPHGEILDDQTGVIDNALDLDDDEKTTVSPTVDPAGLQSDPSSEAEKSKQDAAKLNAAVDKEQEQGWWDKTWTWVTGSVSLATVGVGLLWAVRAAAQFTPYGGLASMLIDPVLHRVPGVGGSIRKIKDLEKRTRTAAATIESSVAGRYALRLLDQRLGDRFGEAIAELTNGHARTVEELFVYIAQGHAVDHPAENHADVDALLDEVKTHMPTDGGLPVELRRLLNFAESKVPSSE